MEESIKFKMILIQFQIDNTINLQNLSNTHLIYKMAMNRIEIISVKDFKHTKQLKKSYKHRIVVVRRRKFLPISKMLNQKSRQD